MAKQNNGKNRGKNKVIRLQSNKETKITKKNNNKSFYNNIRLLIVNSSSRINIKNFIHFIKISHFYNTKRNRYRI